MDPDQNNRILKVLIDLRAVIGTKENKTDDVDSLNRMRLQRQVKDQLEASAQVGVLLRANFNMLSPISSLPLELLGRIFRELRKGSKSYDYWLQSVTHVCVDWRVAAIQDACLWTIVEIGSIEIARLFIGRSRNLPLSFVYRFTDNLKHEPFTEMLQGNIQRVKSLSLQNAENLHYKLWDILRSPFSTLVELSIDMENHFYNIDLSVYLREGYGSLTRLRLHGPFVVPKNLWRALTYLSLSGTAMFDSDQPVLDFTEFLDLLEANPGLVKLKIKSANPKRKSQVSTRTFTMPHLRKVTMKSWRRGHIPDLIPYFMNHIVTPMSLVTKIPDCVITHLASGKRSSNHNDIPPNLRLDKISSLDLEFIERKEGIILFENMNSLKGTIGRGVEFHLPDLSKSLKNVNSVKVTTRSSLHSALVLLQHLHVLKLLKITTEYADSLRLVNLLEDLLITTDDWPNLESIEIAEIHEPKQTDEQFPDTHSFTGPYPKETIKKIVSRPQIGVVALTYLR